MPVIQQAKDKDGIKLKFPTRSCKQCKKYPCILNFELFKCDFAKYGCKQFK